MHLLTFAPAGGDAPSDNRLGDAALTGLELAPMPQRSARDRLNTLLRTDLPDMARRLYSPQLRAALRQTLRDRRFDWVVVEGIEMAPYAGEVLRLGRGRPKWLFDEHNAEFALQRSAALADLRALPRLRAGVGAGYSLVQWRRLRRYERSACRAADAVVAVSPQDRHALLTLDPELDISIVPNGVDVNQWSAGAVAGEAREIAAQYAGPLLVFDGSMDFRPNVDAVVWFCREIFPRIRAARPDAAFAIVGRNPAPAVRALEEMPGVVVTGAVADTRPWVAAATVYVVPMRMGGGVRLKVLQALAMGRPVVSTALGMQGVDAVAGRDFVAADAAADFANEVVAVLADATWQAALGHAARQAALPYSWSAIVPRFAAAMAVEKR